TGGSGFTNPTQAGVGIGAAAPDGGDYTDGLILGSNQKGGGFAGNAPGGGASAPGAGVYGADAPRTRGGGGSGAKCVKTYGAGVLLQGVPITLVVGDSGAAGAAGIGPQNVTGGKGAPGQA